MNNYCIAAEHLAMHGAKVITRGCAEFPLLLPFSYFQCSDMEAMNLLDPTGILAERCGACDNSIPSVAIYACPDSVG